jgi:transmembrane sensor
MNSNDAEIEASQWLARIDAGNVDSADLLEFERWRGADPRRQAAYARLEATWLALSRIRAVRPNSAEPIDEDYLKDEKPRHFTPSRLRPPRLGELRHRLGPAVAPSRTRPFATSWVRFSVPLMLLLVVGGWVASHLVSRPQIFRTGVGEFQRVALADQSVVELDTDTELRVELTARVRKVELIKGEASFEVAHDSSRPFVVTAGRTAVRAVGTRFDVRRSQDSVDITVDEGRVILGVPELLEHATVDTSATVALSAGQSASSTDRGLKLETLSVDGLAQRLAWQDRTLIFSGETLAAVVAQFNRYNRRQLIIEDASLRGLRMGGYFRPTNLDDFVGVLQSDFGVKVVPDGGRLLLTRSDAK